MKKPKPTPGAKRLGTPVPMPKKPARPMIAIRRSATPIEKKLTVIKVKPVKKAAPAPKSTLGPLPKNPTLNDYLKRGMRPPRAPGQKKPPSDADVIIKGYNDPKTIKKYKNK